MNNTDVPPIEVEKSIDIATGIVLPSGKRFYDNSTLNEFRVCPRRFYFRHIRKIEREGGRLPLIFGSSWHAMMDEVWKQDSNDLIPRCQEAFLMEWQKRISPDLDEFDTYPRTPGKAFELLSEYIYKYFDRIKSYQVLGIEEPFIVPLTDDDQLWYVGKLDKIFQDNYGINILDHKTTSQMGASFVSQWSPNSQIDGYAHAGYSTYGNEFGYCYIDAVQVAKTKAEMKLIPVGRSNDQLDAWLWETVSLIEEILYNEELLMSVRSDKKSRTYMPAFPKRTSSCTSYYGLCPYHDLCTATANPEILDHIPSGYAIATWQAFDIHETPNGEIQVKIDEGELI